MKFSFFRYLEKFFFEKMTKKCQKKHDFFSKIDRKLLTRAVSQSLASIEFHRNDICHFRQFAPRWGNLIDFEGGYAVRINLENYGCLDSVWRYTGVPMESYNISLYKHRELPKSKFHIPIFSIKFSVKTYEFF